MQILCGVQDLYSVSGYNMAILYNSDADTFTTVPMYNLSNIQCYYTELSQYPIVKLPDITSRRTIIVLGYITVSNTRYFVITFGNDRKFVVSKYFLMKNAQFAVNWRVVNDSIRYFKNIGIPDISRFFAKQSFEYTDMIISNHSGSIGVNEKYIGKHIATHKVGLIKFPSVQIGEFDDCTNELVCKDLADLFGVPCCEVIKGYSERRYCVMSVYNYNPKTECIKSMRTIMSEHGKAHFDIHTFLDCFGLSTVLELIRVLTFDYITYQCDRHLSNLALLNGHIYPLYDNGRSLNLFHQTQSSRYWTQFLNGILQDARFRPRFNTVTLNDIQTVLSKYYSDVSIAGKIHQRYKSIGGI